VFPLVCGPRRMPGSPVFPVRVGRVFFRLQVCTRLPVGVSLFCQR